MVFETFITDADGIIRPKKVVVHETATGYFVARLPRWVTDGARVWIEPKAGPAMPTPEMAVEAVKVLVGGKPRGRRIFGGRAPRVLDLTQLVDSTLPYRETDGAK